MTAKERRERAAEGNLQLAIQELENMGYRMDHRAKKNGYLSRLDTAVHKKVYIGKFGVGYTLEIPGFNDFTNHPIVYMINDKEF